MANNNPQTGTDILAFSIPQNVSIQPSATRTEPRALIKPKHNVATSRLRLTFTELSPGSVSFHKADLLSAGLTNRSHEMSTAKKTAKKAAAKTPAKKAAKKAPSKAPAAKKA